MILIFIKLMLYINDLPKLPEFSEYFMLHKSKEKIVYTLYFIKVKILVVHIGNIAKSCKYNY